MINYTYDEEGLFHHTVIRADGLAVVYSMAEPEDLLEEGTAVGLADFHDASRQLDLSKGVGTRAMKETVAELAEPEYPFLFVDDLSGSTVGHGICTNFGYVGIKLNNFYVRTQALADYITLAAQLSASERPHTEKTFAVIRAIFNDDVEIASV